jgi:hypothetical protein
MTPNIPLDPNQFDLSTGKGRAAYRMTKKFMQMERLYANTPDLPESRQVRRRKVLIAAKKKRAQDKIIARTEKRKGKRPATAIPDIEA